MSGLSSVPARPGTRRGRRGSAERGFGRGVAVAGSDRGFDLSIQVALGFGDALPLFGRLAAPLPPVGARQRPRTWTQAANRPSTSMSASRWASSRLPAAVITWMNSDIGEFPRVGVARLGGCGVFNCRVQPDSSKRRGYYATPAESLACTVGLVFQCCGPTGGQPGRWRRAGEQYRLIAWEVHTHGRARKHWRGRWHPALA